MRSMPIPSRSHPTASLLKLNKAWPEAKGTPLFWREDRTRPDRLSDAPDALWYAVTPDYLCSSTHSCGCSAQSSTPHYFRGEKLATAAINISSCATRCHATSSLPRTVLE